MPPHALTAGLATFTGMWCLFLFGLAPFMAIETAIVSRHSALVAMPKHLDHVVAKRARLEKSKVVELTTAPDAPKRRRR